METKRETAKHTPGPWIFHRQFLCDGDCDREWYEVRHAQHTHGSLANVVGGNYGNLEANARLIAAAPELLEACKRVLDECCIIHKHWGDNCNRASAVDAEAALRAAIARAEGR